MNLPYQPDFSGKVAVVTGGAGILCREFCKALALCGAKVAVLNRTLSKAEAVVEEIKAAGGEAIAVAVNVTDPASVEAAHQAVLDAWGKCDILINGAGGNDPAATADDEFFSMETLLDEYFCRTLKELIPAWREVVALAVKTGIPMPAFSSALSWFDGYTSASLPANLLQAQRDYFGAHTYERIDAPRGQMFHTNWTGHGGNTAASTYNA